MFTKMEVLILKTTIIIISENIVQEVMDCKGY